MNLAQARSRLVLAWRQFRQADLNDLLVPPAGRSSSSSP